MIRNVIFKLLKNHTIITYFNFLPIILLPHTIIINTLQFSISNLLSIHDNPTTYSRNPNSNPPSSNFSSHRKRRRKKKHRRTKKEERKNNGGTKTGNGKVGSRYHDACWVVHQKKGGGGESGRMRREERWLLPRLRVDPGRAVAGRRVFAVFSLVTRAARRSAAEITA